MHDLTWPQRLELRDRIATSWGGVRCPMHAIDGRWTQPALVMIFVLGELAMIASLLTGTKIEASKIAERPQ